MCFFLGNSHRGVMEFLVGLLFSLHRVFIREGGGDKEDEDPLRF